MEPAPKLQSIKDFRRARIAALLDEHGKVGLSRLVDISADYLWQMGKGGGKSARGVSDANAAKIEAALGKPSGWMDGEETAPQSQSQPLQLDPEIVAATVEALTRLYKGIGREYSIREEPARFVQLYSAQQKVTADPSPENLLEFSKVLKEIEPPQGATRDERSFGVPDDGNGTKDVARARRRKA